MSIQVESNAITGHDCLDDDAANNRRHFVVADPSPELVEIRNAVLAYREVEALSDRNILHALRATEAAMDKKIDAFLTRVPRTADDVVERIEVIAHENCWFTTHADDVPIRLDTFVATLKAAGNEPLHKGAISAPSAIGVIAEDWPEFQPWLADAVALDAYFAVTARQWSTLSDEARHDREHFQNEEMGRLCYLARAIAEKPAHTERHIAMLVTLAVWAAEKSRGDNFNVAAIFKPDDDIAEATSARLLMALAVRTAAILPEVPFTFPTEV